jgi:hypothetical protein
MKLKNIKNKINMKQIRLCLTVSVLIFSWFNISAQLVVTKFTISDGITEGTLKSRIESNVSSLLVACNDAVVKGKKPNVPKGTITKDGEKNLFAIWKTSEIICPLSQVEEKCLNRSTGGYQIRNIPVSLLSAPEEDYHKEIVINLTADGKIDDIFIAIEENRYLDILAERKSVEDFNRRQVIIDFVENFRTAYNRKDIKYITSVFSNDALIITGKVIKQIPNSDQAIQLLGREKVIFQTHRKEEYIKNLEANFKRNKYIDVQFDEIEVSRHPVFPEIFGVTLKQYWKNSSGYKDVGYVFLMIDFRNELEPMIQVRTWQPTTYNNPLPRDEVFGLSTFDGIIRK